MADLILYLCTVCDPSLIAASPQPARAACSPWSHPRPNWGAAERHDAGTGAWLRPRTRQVA